jgi:hypothetical protein
MVECAVVDYHDVDRVVADGHIPADGLLSGEVPGLRPSSRRAS